MPATKLRIAGGTARGVPLTEPKGLRLRPTSGLLREALFNILAAQVEDAAVLDLYAGTGALGIEALSRGAASATFVDAEAASCQAILATLARIAMSTRATVLRGRLPAALASVDGQFDIIFLDPPYQDDATTTLLQLPPFVRPTGVVVYEHASRYNPPERPDGLLLAERRVYGDSAVALYVPQEGE